jgi:hypothetical protein
MHMDMTYTIVPVFGGENKRLYRETKFGYVVNDQNNLVNHPIYVFYEDPGYYILSVYEEYMEALTPTDPLISYAKEVDGIWKMFFDRAYSKEGVGDGVVFISPSER